jgi:DNA-binding NarL/FixJ family response regulator
MNQIRVLVVDDHPVFRYGVQALLFAEPDMLFAGEAETGEEALALVAAEAPDVVLMDLNMPGMNGIETTKWLLQDAPAVAVLVLTMSEDDEAILAAIASGARGYIVKGSPSSQIVRAIRSAAEGEGVFSPSIARRLPGFLAARNVSSGAESSPSLEMFTPREREILNLIAAGLTNAAIADRLYLSPKTIGNRVGEIFDKLGAANRNEAIVLARNAGFG